jgi:hypothetical protein
MNPLILFALVSLLKREGQEEGREFLLPMLLLSQCGGGWQMPQPSGGPCGPPGTPVPAPAPTVPSSTCCLDPTLLLLLGLGGDLFGERRERREHEAEKGGSR